MVRAQKNGVVAAAAAVVVQEMRVLHKLLTWQPVSPEDNVNII